jgi:uncharacterized Rossmann fold enzyme
MEFDEWEPVYRAVLADFGYDRAADERARDLLIDLLPADSRTAVPTLPDEPTTVAVAGAGPSLAADLSLVREADLVFAAATAADTLLDRGLSVDCVVTDLDKHPDTVRQLTREGTPVAVHAHGDNVELIRQCVPDCDPAAVLPTTQAAPVGPVRNFGGFTDGDRAAFLADHLGANSLVFPGWDFDDPDVDGTKARKLRWAERLLYWLERRRGEQFPVLDGRRGAIDTSDLPVE